MSNGTCPWNLYLEEERKDIEDHLFTFRMISGMLSFWLMFGIFCSPNLKDSLSYQNIMAFFTSGWLRNMVTAVVTYTYIINFSVASRGHCALFGFLQTFMAIHEMECLTHICIERYVVAKYITKGWTIVGWHYVLFRILCASFALVYSMAPLMGVGSYGLDFLCAECTMDVILPGGLMMYIAAALFVLRSVKPTVFMVIMLIWAKRLESKFTDNPNNRMQKETTRVVVLLTAVYMLCLAPIGFEQARVVFSQLVHGAGVFPVPSSFYLKVALYLHASAVANSVIVLITLSPVIREAFSTLQPHHFSQFFISFFKKPTPGNAAAIQT